MDAVKFIEERRRMVSATRGHLPIMVEGISPKDIVKEVEEWAAAHPRKTRQDIFLEQWPEACLTKDSVISLCPAVVSAAHRNKAGGCASPTRPQCEVCCREFWTKVVK